jgi:uncharacterized protein (TIGR02246 family)
MILTMRAGDPAWTTKLHETFASTLHSVGNPTGIDFSISEEYRDPPPDLVPADGAALGWTCRIVDGEVVEFARTPQADVDCRVALDYPVFAELAASVIDGDPDKQGAMQRRQASAIADGTMTVVGGLDKAPACLADVHDTMARVLGARRGSDTDDIVAIQQLLARYNTAADLGDGEGFAATFTEDGVAAAGATVTTGRAALAERGNGVPDRTPGIRHWVNNHVINVDGDDATATVYVMVVVTGAGGPKIVASGRYSDQMRRTVEGWRFSRREFAVDG